MCWISRIVGSKWDSVPLSTRLLAQCPSPCLLCPFPKSHYSHCLCPMPPYLWPFPSPQLHASPLFVKLTVSPCHPLACLSMFTCAAYLRLVPQATILIHHSEKINRSAREEARLEMKKVSWRILCYTFPPNLCQKREYQMSLNYCVNVIQEWYLNIW